MAYLTENVSEEQAIQLVHPAIVVVHGNGTCNVPGYTWCGANTPEGGWLETWLYQGSPVATIYTRNGITYSVRAL